MGVNYMTSAGSLLLHFCLNVVASAMQQVLSCSDAQPLNSKNHLSPPPKNNGSKDMQPLRSTSSLHLTRVQAKESSQSLWKARSWRFGSRYVRPRSLSMGNGEVAVVLSLP